VPAAAVPGAVVGAPLYAGHRPTPSISISACRRRVRIRAQRLPERNQPRYFPRAPDHPPFRPVV